MRLINSFLIGLLIPSLALANYPPTTIKGQTDASAKTKFGFQVPFQQATDLGGTASLIETGNSNIVPDPGFEASVSGWTASGGATATANTTAKGTGLKGYDWDSNAAAQTLVSQTITIPEGFKGKNGTVSCNIKTVSGTSTHTITANDGTNDIVSAQTIASSTSVFTDNKVNFIFPSSGSIRVKITSVAANEPEIYIDDCRLGLADNIGTVQQARLVGTVTITGCASAWSTTSTTFASFATVASCSYAVTGEALAPTTNIPAIRFASLPPGEYKVEYEGALFTQATAGRQDADFQIFDGTNQYRETSAISGTSVGDFKPNFMASYSYTAPQNNITLQVRAKTSNSQTTQIYGTTSRPGVIRVYYFPSASQQAVSSANSDYSGASLTLTSSNTQGFGTPTGSCTHDRVGGNLLMNCKYTSGTVAASEARVNLPSGLTSADTTRIPSIQVVGNAVVSNTGANILYVLIEPSTGYVTFGRQNATDSGLTKLNGNVVMGSAATMSFQVSIPIQGWSSNQRAPTLVGSVTSNSSGAERIERAIVDCSTTGSVSSSSSAWLTVGNISANRCAITIASGTFSAKPTCTCSFENVATTALQLCNMNVVSATSMSIGMVQQIGANTTAGSGVGVNNFHLVCYGPR